MPRLVFDFPDPASASAPEGDRPAARWSFRDPVEVVIARDRDGVRPAIRRVQEATAGGLHAAGFVAYEAAPAFEPAMRVRAPGPLPLVWFGIFDAPERLGAESPGAAPDPDGNPDGAGDADADARLDWRLEWSREEYGAAVDEVRAAIAEGRTYQVNLTTRMRAAMRGDPWSLYERMRRSQRTGYHAYLDLDDHVILSASPELFFETRGRAITTRPMKGTRPRGRWPEEDRALAGALSSSEKERAENLMIVDLLRNDLGRVCDTGSIRATSLQRVERYPTVWQLTSTIDGRLRDDIGLAGIFDALFPCGSVTGAPKISTMAEIARLEASPRGAYCGAIGWVRPGGDCVFSVPIRTAWLDRATGGIEYGTGGGVVWDSTADGEYDELRAKAVVARDPWPEFALLETLALRDGGYIRRDRHLARMRESADRFDFPWPAARIEAALDDLAALHPRGDFLARLVLPPDGEPTATARALEPPTGAGGAGEPALPAVALAPDPVDSADLFLFHKTTHRDVYDARRAAAPERAMDALLLNERGEVTEFTRGNLVAELDGERVTPARESGLLAGCLRQELLESGEVVERVVRVADLDRATRLWFINSARGWIEVELRR